MKIKVIDGVDKIITKGEASLLLDPNGNGLLINAPGLSVLLDMDADEASLLAAKASAMATLKLVQSGEE